MGKLLQDALKRSPVQSTPKPTKQDIEIGRKIFRNWCRDNNLAVDPVAASDLVQKIAEAIAVLSDALVGRGQEP